MTRECRIRSTKIVCTLGPATSDPAVLRELVEAGMDVARLNFSHGEHDTHAAVVPHLRRIAADLDRPVAIIADLQGPKIRIGTLPQERVLLEGERITLVGVPETDSPVPEDALPVVFPQLAEVVSVGSPVLMADGAIRMHVDDIDPGSRSVECIVESAGVISSRKGVNLPGTSLNIPPLTPKDIRDLRFAIEQGVDYIAMSFVRSADDVEHLRIRIAENCRSEPPQIITKIEKREAVDRLESIVAVSDAVMVARGDLGVELGVEQVPLVQKRIIELAIERSLPVITATQMLESMIHQAEPTRAEASDVANAILDGTSAVMLSAETAMGRFPVQTVRVMDRIARVIEPAMHPPSSYLGNSSSMTTGQALTAAACEVAEVLDASAIVVATATGRTARQVSRHRPRKPIIAVSHSPRVIARLALDWGTVPMLIEPATDTDDLWLQSVEGAVRSGLIRDGEQVVYSAGSIMNVPGLTNMLKVEELRVPRSIRTPEQAAADRAARSNGGTPAEGQTSESATPG